MKANEKKPAAGKLIICLVVAVVVAGAVSLSSVADFGQGSGIMAILFIAFLGAIIAVQAIPGLMLFGMMLKGLASLFSKEKSVKGMK